jgi:PAS domain S-box-containing protein
MKIRKVPWLTLLMVAVLLIVALLRVIRITPENRTYIIGWDLDPPDQVATKSGEPTGFAVELVREAAKRRGIRLQWVEHPESSEAALRSKAVDLWPMMVITEDRKQILHLTDPYQEDQYGLLVDAKSAFTKADDLKQRTISYDGMPFNGRLLREHFPGAVHLRKSSLADAVRSVCVGEAQAVFDDRIAVFSVLLSNQACPGTSLRMLAIPTIKTRIGIGATRESRAAADAIREEIDVMAGDGSLGKIMSVWSYDSGQELDSLVVLQRAKSQLRWYKIGLAAVAALFLFASWAAAGYRKQRIKAQTYCQAFGQAEWNVRLVADSLSEMVVAYDMNRSLTYANSGAEKLTGYGLAELQVADFLSWTHPEDRPQVLALWDKVFDGQAVDQVDYRLIAKDGTVKWVTGAWGPVVDETGRLVGVRGTCRDITELVVTEQARQDAMQKFRTIVQEITERKRAEQVLRESEERFRNMADTAPVMIWVSGPDKLFTFFNKTWLDFTGRTLEQELGNGWVEGVHPDDLGHCYESFSSSFDARRNFNIELRLRRADGEYRWVLCSGVPRFEPGGVFAGYIGSDIDITDQKHAEAMLRQNLDEIAHLNRVAAMGELTASMAHELNQPLAAILSNAQAASRFLSSESPDLTQARECLTDIAADDKRAGEVIKSLRELLKKGKFQMSVVDLNEVVGEVIRLVGHHALLGNVSIRFEPLPSLHPVLGDRIQLYQMVLNLIVNGLDATAERPRGERWVLVRTVESSGGVELSVEDSGKGIAESDLSHLFEPFFSTKREGLGMGLSISSSIVRAHGGRIWAERSVGRGAIFHCVLPVAQQAAAANVVALG